MRIEKKTLNDALRVLGKVVCQTSPVEPYRSIRFTGDEDDSEHPQPHPDCRTTFGQCSWITRKREWLRTDR